MVERNAVVTDGEDSPRSGSAPGERRATAAAVGGAMSSIFPAFLTGAIGVQLGVALGLGEGALGFAIGCYFASAAAGSAVLGRLAEALGGSAALRVGLVFTTLSMLVIGLFVDNPAGLTVALAVAGVGNALNQPAANLIIAERLDPARMGLAIAVKQSGMPLATLLGGAMVPSVAETVGWRWAYLIGSGLAIGAGFLAPRGRGPGAPSKSTGGVPDLPMSLLLLFAVVGTFAASAVVSLAGFLVVGAEDAGIESGLSGILLAVGSAVGVSSRLLHGRLADIGRIRPIRRASTLMYLGSLGFLLLSFHRPATYLIGPLLAFGCGWAWPGLINLSVLRNNPSAPAAATGISQTGVFIGSGTGPILGGQIIEHFGYRVFWLTGGAMLVVAGSGAALLSTKLRAR